MTKKNVLFLGLAALALIILLAIIDANFGRSCVYEPEDGYSVKYCENFALSLLPLLSLIPFSIFFFFLREEVFRVWWNFVRWFVPIIMLATFLLNSAHRGGGIAGAAAASFNMFVLGILYVIFVVVSLVKIVREHRKNK